MMNKKLICRGEIWFVDLDPTIGHEQAKKRPCLVISESSYNQGPAELIVIIPITSKFRQIAWFVQLDPGNTGLKTVSYAMTNQIRTVSLMRFTGSRIGLVDALTLKAIEQRLKILLEL